MRTRMFTRSLLVGALLLAVMPVQPALAHVAHVCAAPATASLVQTCATMTHLSMRQIARRRASGTSLSQICRDRGVDPAAVLSTTMAKYRRSVRAAVGHGLTQARADRQYRIHRRSMERFMDASHGNAGGSHCASGTADPSHPTTGCPGPSRPASDCPSPSRPGTDCPAPSCPTTTCPSAPTTQCPSAPETFCPGPRHPGH